MQQTSIQIDASTENVDIIEDGAVTVFIKIFLEFLLPKFYFETLLVRPTFTVENIICEIKKYFHLDECSERYLLVWLDFEKLYHADSINDVDVGPKNLVELSRDGVVLERNTVIFQQHNQTNSDRLETPYDEKCIRLYICKKDEFVEAKKSISTRDSESVTQSCDISCEARRSQFVDQQHSLLEWTENDDLVDLPILNEEIILETLRERFDKGRFYTYVGGILVSINPYKGFPIYNPSCAMTYRNYQYGKFAPHIFALTDMAYNQMLKHNACPSIVISGESGSGKTECAKHVVEYLSYISPQRHLFDDKSSPLSASIILEIFGNAVTNHNSNSSRFGKYTKLHYNCAGAYCGSFLRSFLLERSRIVFVPTGERNFHIFYAVISGLKSQMKQMLFLNEDTSNFRYLGNNYTSDARDVMRFVLAMRYLDQMNLDRYYKNAILRLVSAILHIGQLEFIETEVDNNVQTDIINTDVLAKICNLLMIDQSSLSKVILTSTQIIKGESILLHLNRKMADLNKDSLAKSLYVNMFEWLINQINDRMAPVLTEESKIQTHSMSYLDIFGFENLENNGFEQFCINYANEHIQNYLNEHIFQEQQHEYVEQEIKWNMINFADNSGCINLICSRIPAGLISLIDEESSLSVGTDSSLLMKMSNRHKGNNWINFPLKNNMCFSISHYAGSIMYNIEGFKVKNQDCVRYDLLKTVRSSRFIPICEMMGSDPIVLGRWETLKQKIVSINQTSSFISDLKEEDIDERRNRRQGMLFQLLNNDQPKKRLSREDIISIEQKKQMIVAASSRCHRTSSRSMVTKSTPSVICQFNSSLLELMDTLRKSHPFFVRCIRPNTSQKPLTFDKDLVMQQLNHTGLRATVQIRQVGFDCRITYEKFFNYFKILIPSKNKDDIIPLLTSFSIKTNQFSLGSTKIFMKSSIFRKLTESQEKIANQHYQNLNRIIGRNLDNLVCHLHRHIIKRWIISHQKFSHLKAFNAEKVLIIAKKHSPIQAASNDTPYVEVSTETDDFTFNKCKKSMDELFPDHDLPQFPSQKLETKELSELPSTVVSDTEISPHEEAFSHRNDGAYKSIRGQKGALRIETHQKGSLMQNIQETVSAGTGPKIADRSSLHLRSELISSQSNIAEHVLPTRTETHTEGKNVVSPAVSAKPPGTTIFNTMKQMQLKTSLLSVPHFGSLPQLSRSNTNKSNIKKTGSLKSIFGKKQSAVVTNQHQLSLSKLSEILINEVGRINGLMATSNNVELQFYKFYSKVIVSFISILNVKGDGIKSNETFISLPEIRSKFDDMIQSTLKSDSFSHMKLDDETNAKVHTMFKDVIDHINDIINPTQGEPKKPLLATSSNNLVDGLKHIMKRRKTEHIMNGHVMSSVSNNGGTFRCDRCQVVICDATVLKCSACYRVYHKTCCMASSMCDKKPQSDGDITIYGGSLKLLSPPPDYEIPQIFKLIVEELERKGLKDEGIYRVSGKYAIIKETIEKINDPTKISSVDLTVIQPPNLAALVKQFVSRLTEPLVPKNEYELLMKNAETLGDDELLDACLEIVDCFPQPNRGLFLYLLHHLAKLNQFNEYNKMDASNIAIVFSPCIFSIFNTSSVNTDHFPLHNKILIKLIEHFTSKLDFEEISEEYVSSETNTITA